MNIGQYQFEEPVLLESFRENDRAAIYVILAPVPTPLYMLFTGRTTPQITKWLDVGQTGQSGTRIANHDRKKCWIKTANGDSIYVALFPTPTDVYSKEARLEIERDVRTQLKPSCGNLPLATSGLIPRAIPLTPPTAAKRAAQTEALRRLLRGE